MSCCAAQQDLQRKTPLLPSDKSNRRVGACDSYSGGEIVKGSIVATVDETGALDMRYQHVNIAGRLMVSLLDAAHAREDLSLEDLSTQTDAIVSELGRIAHFTDRQVRFHARDPR